MKKWPLINVWLMLLCILTGVSILKAQSSVVTFRADLSGVEMEDPTMVGIRGSLAPLSWDETYPMEDPDNDGVYTATVDFGVVDPGKRVLYKYVHGEVNWENDRFGPFGNRVLNLCNCAQTIPVERWDQMVEFAPEMLLENLDGNNFSMWIYVIASGMKEGKTASEAMADFTSFWADPLEWITGPEMMIYLAKVRQSSSVHGKLEVIENKPGTVKYKERNIWLAYLESWGKDGEWMGVTKDDVKEAFKYYTEFITDKKGWELTWEEDGLDVIVTITNP